MYHNLNYRTEIQISNCFFYANVLKSSRSLKFAINIERPLIAGSMKILQAKDDLIAEEIALLILKPVFHLFVLILS